MRFLKDSNRTQLFAFDFCYIYFCNLSNTSEASDHFHITSSSCFFNCPCSSYNEVSAAPSGVANFSSTSAIRFSKPAISDSISATAFSAFLKRRANSFCSPYDNLESSDWAGEAESFEIFPSFSVFETVARCSSSRKEASLRLSPRPNVSCLLTRTQRR